MFIGPNAPPSLHIHTRTHTHTHTHPHTHTHTHTLTHTHACEHLQEFSDWSQCQVVELAAAYEPVAEAEIYDMMNALEDRLTVTNSAVVLATTKAFLHFTLGMPAIHQQVCVRVFAVSVSGVRVCVCMCVRVRVCLKECGSVCVFVSLCICTCVQLFFHSLYI
jgi:hypothetical protein